MYVAEMEKYRIQGSVDEWFTAKLIERCISKLDEISAFEETGTVFVNAANEMEWDIFLIHCQYISALANLANTTELPSIAKESWPSFVQRVNDFNLSNHSEVKQVYAWYRYKT